MKKLKLTKIAEEKMNEKELWKIKGGIVNGCTDSDGCALTLPTGSKFGTDMEADNEQ